MPQDITKNLGQENQITDQQHINVGFNSNQVPVNTFPTSDTSQSCLYETPREWRFGHHCIIVVSFFSFSLREDSSLTLKIQLFCLSEMLRILLSWLVKVI